MKKVGIITYYYKSINYGGNLQAYALAYYINTLGEFEAEQICYDFWESTVDCKYPITSDINKQSKSRLALFKHPISIIKKIVRRIVYSISFHHAREKVLRLVNNSLQRDFAQRAEVIKNFNKECIPHSSCVYNDSSISSCNDLYDVFITGSDQVWSVIQDPFALSFVKKKPKISYSASIARKIISDEHKEYLKDRLKDYKAISVRDRTDKEIVSELTDIQVDITLDPTLLLSRENWDSVVPTGRRYDSYVFCYFLGDNKEYKKIVKQFAHKRKLKVVTIAHFLNNYSSALMNDVFFGDIRPYDVSPLDFIALIRDAEYVFTDSFHASVFSILYHKQFFVFDRQGIAESMNSRILDLLQQFGFDSRFCYGNGRESLDYLNMLKPIDYRYCDSILKKARADSRQFLLDNL